MDTAKALVAQPASYGGVVITEAGTHPKLAAPLPKLRGTVASPHAG